MRVRNPTTLTRPTGDDSTSTITRPSTLWLHPVLMLNQRGAQQT
jgi:hypothetical protein